MSDIRFVCPKCRAEHLYGGWIPRKGTFGLECNCGENVIVVRDMIPLEHIGPIDPRGLDKAPKGGET